MNNIEIAKNIADRVNNVMSFQGIAWFYCFGTLLEFVRSSGERFDITHDIDIGVFYNECDSDTLIKNFENMGYRYDSKVINNLNHKPLNIHFSPVDLSGSPFLDVFFWIEKNGILYHTYDYSKEMKEQPSQYVFKGVKKEYMIPSKNKIKEERLSHLEGDRLLTEKGVWTYSIFGDHSGYIFNCPFAYGTLLDNWYPGWMITQKHYGQSKSEFVKKVKSCGKL